MLSTLQIFLLVVVAISPDSSSVEAEAVKRDLAGNSGLEFIHLGHLGPISRLSSHPGVASLGLTPQQTLGLMNLLLQNGVLNPNALRLPNGDPFYGGPYLGGGYHTAFFGPNVHPVDPYLLYLFTNHARYLPLGLGPQGIYGSTGLPKAKPLGVFKYTDKN